MAREHELYADSAQAREMDRRFTGDSCWVDIDSKQAKANNQAWLQMIRRQDEHHRNQMRGKIAAAVDQIGNRWGYMGPRRPQ
ncbi:MULTISPECIES: hypothetical protein [Pseudomonas]|uniref:hypothetical protein n=1 Tax=Pseudomonas TaxID=286 RepID=UPI0003C7A433|nr:hypothetical protein [Pseudomonas sp. BJa3]MCX5511248.1 hypothetical protein [Pseudomonas sp. BJa3]